MSDIDIFEEAIFKFGVDATIEYFGIEPGSTFYDCFYKSLKEREKVYLMGNNKEYFEQAKLSVERKYGPSILENTENLKIHQNIHPLIDKSKNWEGDQDPIKDIERAIKKYPKGFKRAIDLIKPKVFSEQEIKKTKEFLKENGIQFFKNLKQKHGIINIVFEENGLPHAIHFHEGKQIRNFMRTELGYSDDEWLEHKWINLIEQVLKEENNG